MWLLASVPSPDRGSEPREVKVALVRAVSLGLMVIGSGSGAHFTSLLYHQVGAGMRAIQRRGEGTAFGVCFVWYRTR
jgi:hypothetical protein